MSACTRKCIYCVDDTRFLVLLNNVNEYPVCVLEARTSVAHKPGRTGRAAVLHAGGGVGEDVVAGGQSAGDSEGGEREARKL